MSLLRPLLERLARAGAPLDRIERSVRAQQRRESSELTPAERSRLSRERWAKENDLQGAYEDARVARAEQWVGWDVAPPADGDEWLTDPDYRDESWHQIYETEAPLLPSEQLRGRRWRDIG